MTKSINDYSELEEELRKLREGETLVTIWKEKKGYYLFIGDELVNHLWAITEAELRELQKLLNNKFKNDT